MPWNDGKLQWPLPHINSTSGSKDIPAEEDIPTNPI